VDDILVPLGTSDLYQEYEIIEGAMKQKGMTTSQILELKTENEKKIVQKNVTTQANCIALGRILLYCLGQNIQIPAHVLVS
jgi:hypothetical protein